MQTESRFYKVINAFYKRTFAHKCTPIYDKRHTYKTTSFKVIYYIQPKKTQKLRSIQNTQLSNEMQVKQYDELR